MVDYQVHGYCWTGNSEFTLGVAGLFNLQRLDKGTEHPVPDASVAKQILLYFRIFRGLYIVYFRLLGQYPLIISHSFFVSEFGLLLFFKDF